jgi:S-adenosylmethionine hydrolase
VKTNPLGLEGCIQAIDHFGNGITTIAAEHLGDRPWHLLLGTTSIPQATTYGSVSPDQPLALVGSHGWLEIAVNQGNAQAQLGFTRGDRVTLLWT